MSPMILTRRDLPAFFRAAFSLAATATKEEAREWLMREGIAQVKFGKDLMEEMAQAAMVSWRTDTGTCPTCGLDPQTHEVPEEGF